MTVSLVKAQNCPKCDALHDAVTQMAGPNDGRVPKAGDVTCCFNCTAFLIFGEAQTLRELTLDELAALHPDTRFELVRLRRALETFNARRS